MKKNIFKVLTAFLVTFLFLGSINATDVAAANETVIQDGEYDSTRLIAGNNVTNKAKIDGLSFGAGNVVNAYGNSSYGFYAGNVVTVGEKIEKDLFVAGNSIIISKESELGRDVFIAGNTVSISSDIARDLRVGASSIVLGDITISGDAYLEAERINLSEKTVITGKLYYPSTATVVNIDKASIGSVEVQEVEVTDTEAAEKIFKGVSLGAFIIFLVAAIITLLVILGFIPSLKDKLDKVKVNFNDVAVTCLIGLGVLIVIPVLSIFTIFTGLLTPITIIILVLYGIGLYVSRLFGAYVIGSRINNVLFKKNGLFVSSVIGVILVRLVSLIPIFGGLVKLLVLVYGLGLIYNLITTSKKKK